MEISPSIFSQHPVLFAGFGEIQAKGEETTSSASSIATHATVVFF